MQNEPNLQGGKMNINSYKTSNYKQKPLAPKVKNKAKQSQTNPISHRHQGCELDYRIGSGQRKVEGVKQLPQPQAAGLNNGQVAKSFF